MTAFLDKLRTSLGTSLREIAIHVAAICAFASGFIAMAAHALPAKYALPVSGFGALVMVADRIALAIQKDVPAPTPTPAKKPAAKS